MILLDTNVISELTRPNPSQEVALWLDEQESPNFVTSVIVETEILFGLLSLPQGSRRSRLISLTERVMETLVEGRVLPFDRNAAKEFAIAASHRRALGRPLNLFDGMIAATALATGAVVATRNLSDFDGLGLTLINPWNPTS